MSGSWHRRYRPSPDTALRLACFPHAGGGASFYRRWALALWPAIEVLAVQYPGREDRVADKPVDDMAVLASAICDELCDEADVPLALFGHSLGAAIAHEVALRLEARGMQLERLVVSGRMAPHRLLPGRERHLLPDNELWEEVRRLNGTNDLVLESAELRALVMPALRSDYRLAETLRPVAAEPLDAPITAVAGATDPEITLDGVRAWSERTDSGFELLVLPGDHFYLIGEQQRLLDELRRRLVPALLAPAWPSTP